MIGTLFLSVSLNAQQTLTVTHSTAGDMATEISAALGSTNPTSIETLVINGDAFLTYDDCRAVATNFSTADFKKLDLSAAKFENNTIPGHNGQAVDLGAFGGMSMVETVLPEDLMMLGSRSFRNCKKLTTINLPEALTRLSDASLAMCASLDLEELPKNLKTIDTYVFYQCYAMKSLTELPETLEGKIGDQAFGQTSVAIEYIPEGVTEIGNSAFNAGTRAVSMEGLNFYQSLTKIGSTAFKNQTTIEYIEANRMTPPETNVNAFDGLTLGAIDLYVPKGAKAAYEEVEPWNKMRILDTLDPPVVGLDKIKGVAGFSIYPNPAVNEITVTVSDNFVVESAKIINLSGATVKDLQVNTSFTFNVTDLTAGIYFLQLNESTSVKFIKK